MYIELCSQGSGALLTYNTAMFTTLWGFSDLLFSYVHHVVRVTEVHYSYTHHVVRGY